MDARTHAFHILLALTGAIRAASAQTITVDIEDASVFDVPDTATVVDLPGPDGHISFGEAMVASNNTPGRQTVAFAIPTSEWTHNPEWYPGLAVVFGWVPNMSANDEVTIDGTTQTAFTGDTNPDGWEVQLLTEFFVAADNCRITGLYGTAVWVDGSNCVVENNSAMSIHLYGGFGGSSSAGNLVKDNTGLGFLHIDQSSDNVVVGNTFRQVRLGGYVAGGFQASNNRIGGPTPAERNYIVGTGSATSQGFPGGFALQIVDATDTVVENNQIGTSLDGMSIGHANSIAGILIDGENNNTTIRNNRIAGVLAWAVPPHAPAYQIGAAIRIGGSGSGLQIVGNKIGLNALDQPVLGSITGIETLNYYLGAVQNVAIGGSAPGEGNEIAGHLSSGISVTNSYSGVRIRGNSIHDNGGLGIDLITSGLEVGVTLNDPLDVDTGGNRLQNFPVLQSATLGGGMLRVVGTLNSSPSSSFTLEFFASPECDASGFGEGQDYLGSTTVVTDSSGDAAFDLTLPAAVQTGWFVASTATDAASLSTSEFSACIEAEGPGPDGTDFCDATDNALASCPCANPGDPGTGCDNAQSTGGVSLAVLTQTTSPNGATLQGTGFSTMGAPTALVIRSNDLDPSSPVVFGDGLRCINTTPLVRLAATTAVGGISTHTFGHGAGPGTFYYQLWYRNTPAAYCTPAAFNLSNGRTIVW